MRISDERYERDLGRYDLARRMLRLEARTGTVCAWTSLSESRLRSLSKSAYVTDGDLPPVRHRGPAPYRVDVLFSDPRLRSHCTLITTIAVAMDALPDRSGFARKTLATAERLCCVYEVYLKLETDAPLTFDHLILLGRTLGDRAEIRLDSCDLCDGLLVLSTSDTPVRRCEACQHPESRAELRCAEPDANYDCVVDVKLQLSLF